MSSSNAVIDDEVSTVLRHFRPRPVFVSSNSDHHGLMKSSSKRQRQGNNNNLVCHDRGFSSVKYNAALGHIILDYLHVHKTHQSESSATCIFLTFHIEVNTKLVSCVQCSAPAEEVTSNAIKLFMNERCKEELSFNENDGSSSSGGNTTSTLFSIASRLLQLLNKKLPTYLMNNKKILFGEESFDTITRRLATAKECKKRPSTSRMIHRLIDLQTLLLRCAAAGRNRAKILAPIPVEFSYAAGGNGDTLARMISGASNQLYVHGFRGDQVQHQMQMQQHIPSDEAWTLLSFLLSLPWTGNSHLLAKQQPMSTANNSEHDKNNAIQKVSTLSKNKVGRLCLEIRAALGDPSPVFTKLARKYGTVQAYHWTKIESAWSILNHGLQNLSYNAALSQNGAMMGEGVYLSSLRQVAESFAISAAERPPKTLSLAFQHESLLHLLCHANVDIATLDPLDSYDIKILPIFEATIIKPSPDAVDDDDAKKCTTRQEGKYFVCTDSEFVRITKLHLTFELSKKFDVWHRLLLLPMHLFVGIIVVMVAILWAIIG